MLPISIASVESKLMESLVIDGSNCPKYIDKCWNSETNIQYLVTCKQALIDLMLTKLISWSFLLCNKFECIQVHINGRCKDTGPRNWTWEGKSSLKHFWEGSSSTSRALSLGKYSILRLIHLWKTVRDNSQENYLCVGFRRQMRDSHTPVPN